MRLEAGKVYKLHKKTIKLCILTFALQWNLQYKLIITGFRQITSGSRGSNTNTNYGEAIAMSRFDCKEDDFDDDETETSLENR